MFNDTEIKILTNSNAESYIKTEYGDIQPFSKSISFEDGFEINITKRGFLDIESSINFNSYLIIDDNKYKVIDMKKWDSYIEFFLYRCKR
ncbi:hypothetical protein [Clostridium sp.]|uniref:hypothetical protein n=1 Tax=Clostridium sp. TaxID=1506 RepID=UPI001A5003DE|nr:hypothetical protein [Clostridium sp.]MBK5242051.1 hypothetical protein [Clostridium sp.]